MSLKAGCNANTNDYAPQIVGGVASHRSRASDGSVFMEPRPLTGYTHDVKALYKYCEFFFTNTFVGSAIIKLAQFAVEGLTIKSESEEAEREAQRIIRKVRLKESLIRAIRDYQLYGIFIIYPMYRHRKTLKCKVCDTVYRLDDLHKENVAQYRRDSDGKYYSKCMAKHCRAKGKEAEMHFVEMPLTDADNIQIALWSPNRVSVSHNMVTGDKQYAYEIDHELTRKVQANDHFIMCTLPEVFINAATKDKKVIINSDKIFVYEAPSITIHGLPIPPLVRAFYDLGLRIKYMDANRTIASDTLLPLRMLFPIERGTAAGAPLAQTVNLQGWVESTRTELKRFQMDKSYVPIMPVEVGVANLWGDGKLLSTEQEMRANRQDILSIMGTPIEFMDGGVTWSRQNTSSKVLQNQIQMVNDATQDTVSFIQDKINQNKPEEERVEIKMIAPELVEEYAKLAYLAQEHEKGSLSSETYYKHLGEDYNTEQRYKKRELERYTEMRTMVAQQAGQMQYEQTKAQLTLQSDQREMARREDLKDSIARAGIERDMREIELRNQTRHQLIQMRLQQMSEERQRAIQEAMSDREAQKQMEIMKEQLKLQEESQLRSTKGYMELQLDNMKQEGVALLEAEDAMEEHQRTKELERQFESFPPEVQQEIMQAPEEERENLIQDKVMQMQYQEIEQSLDEEQRIEYDQLPDEDKQAYLDQIMQAQQQEAQVQEEQQQVVQDPSYIKEQAKAQAKLNPELIQEKAMVYNRLTPDQRQIFEAEQMQEDTEVYTKMKQMADEMATYEYVSKLLNANPEQAEIIWKEISVTRPEITDDVYNQIEEQLLYMDQAAKYALHLYSLKDNEEAWNKASQEINENSPEAFRKMIYNEYNKLITGSKKKEGMDFQLDIYANAVAGSAMSMSDEDRNNLLLNIKMEAPDLYKRVMKKFMDMDVASGNDTLPGMEPVAATPGRINKR